MDTSDIIAIVLGLFTVLTVVIGAAYKVLNARIDELTGRLKTTQDDMREYAGDLTKEIQRLDDRLRATEIAFEGHRKGGKHD